MSQKKESHEKHIFTKEEYKKILREREERKKNGRNPIPQAPKNIGGII